MVRRFALLGLVASLAACVGDLPECPSATPRYVDVPSASDLHDVDATMIVGADGSILAGVDFEIQTTGVSGDLRAIERCPISEGCLDYVVGDAGLALAGDDGEWTPIDLGLTADLFDVVRSDAAIVVVGDGVLRVWNEWEGPGAGFDPAPPDPAGWGTLRDISGHVVVGDGGRIYETEDLHTWTRASVDTVADLLALGYVDRDPLDTQPGELWAVGRGGTILVRQPDGWAGLDYGLDVDLLDFDAGFAITSDARVIELRADGSAPTIAELDRQPLALEAFYASGGELILTVVGEAGLVATVDPCP